MVLKVDYIFLHNFYLIYLLSIIKVLIKILIKYQIYIIIK